jgi:hypothetical protein
MIEIGQIQEIIAQYEKHGWNLRRVLLSAENSNSFPQSVSGSVEVIESNIDALWFARASNEGREAWELRRLSGAPFALVEVFEADDEEEAREEARQEMETRLAELASKFGDKKVSG